MFPRPSASTAPLFALYGTLTVGCIASDDPAANATPDSEPSDTGDMVSPPEGLDVLYIGHSFGRPFSWKHMCP